MTRAATESEHDQLRRRLEASGGAVFELPAGQRPARSSDEIAPASQRVRLQRPGEPELTLRNGVLYNAAGVVMPGLVPDWARESIISVAGTISRLETAEARLRAKNKET